MMKIEIRNKAQYKKTKWLGGETTEFYIYPIDSNYKDKKFDFRLSSANFSLDDSTFTEYSDYMRFIAPLKGKLDMNHEGHHSIILNTFEIDYFDGDWVTKCKPSPGCADFNLIVKKGLKAGLRTLNFDESYESMGRSVICAYCISPKAEALISSSGKKHLVQLSEGEMLVINHDETIQLLLRSKCNKPQLFIADVKVSDIH